MVRTLVILFIIILASIVILRKLLSKRNLEKLLRPPPIPSNDIADYDWSITTMDDQQLDMTQTKGKVIFLNFWSTSCPPCLVEMPSIQRLYENIKDLDVVFLCVSRDSKEKIISFINKTGHTLPYFTLSSELPCVFLRQGVPATFIISKNGRIVFDYLGSAKWDDQKCIDFLRELVAQHNDRPQITQL